MALPRAAQRLLHEADAFCISNPKMSMVFSRKLHFARSGTPVLAFHLLHIRAELPKTLHQMKHTVSATTVFFFTVSEFR